MKTYFITIAVTAWVIAATMLLNLCFEWLSVANTVQNIIAPFIMLTTVFITIFIYKLITKTPKNK